MVIFVTFRLADSLPRELLDDWLRARDAFLAALLDGKAYLNVHSNTYPGGEIRGFFAQVPVPGPVPLLGAGAALGWSRRLRRRQAASR